MPKYNILGIGVDFPFDAYQPQLIYMEKVILSLQKNKNALLESPTGTGKTLCLLCATLAWRDDQVQKMKAAELDHGEPEYPGYMGAEPQAREKPPQIIYASRTHSQLGQVIKELNRTSYRPKVKMCILGSRHQLCVHPTVSNQKGSNINRMCRQKVSTKMCEYHGNVQDMKGQYPEVEDIESFKEWGRAHHVCSYFLSKDQKTDADIIFMPYNYVLDPLIRKTLGLDLTGAVVILDEAHNVESVAADCGSFELTSLDFQGCVDELTKCIDTYQHDGAVLPEAIPPEAPDLAGNLPVKLEEANKLFFTPKQQEAPNQQTWTMSSLKDTLIQLKSAIEAIVVPQDGFTKPGNYIYDLLKTFNITFDTKPHILQILETAADLLANDTNLVRSFRSNSALSNLSEALRKLFMDGMGPMESIAQHYKVHVQDEQRRPGPGSSAFRPSTPLRRLSFWCFNAGIIMQDLAKSGVRNFILTSGTLSPLDSFAYELALEFPKECRLENPHVIDTRQIWVGAVAKATNGAKLLGTFSNRNEDYYRGLGISLANVCRIVPDGVLVFFPSYAVLDACMQSWRKEEAGKYTTWETIVKYKQPVIEPRESNQLSNAIADYEAKIKATSVDGPKGAVFFAVARGKVSEGLDFANENGRAVVIIGIPFPNSQDPRINLKKTYLNDMKAKLSASSIPVSTGAGAISGEEWYRQSAWRAINQAVGRVIRHRLDYGAIILADERFCKEGERHLSKWLRTQVKSFQDCGPMFGSLTGFFNRLKNDPPSLQLRLPSATSSSVAAGGPPSAVRSVNESNVRNASTSDLFHSIDQGKKIEADKSKPKSAGDKTDAKQKLMQERSRQYLQLVRTLLEKEEYDNFKEIMKAYKAKQITVQEVMERHLVLYGVSPDREELRQNFVVFLPSESRTEWLGRVQKMMDAHKEAEERKKLEFSEATASPAPPKPSFPSPQGSKDRRDLEENIIDDEDELNTRQAEEEDDIFEGILASSRAPAPLKPPISSSKDSKKEPLAFENNAAAITIEDEEDEPLRGFVSASTTPPKPVDAFSGSSWIKSINRHRGRPNITDADFAAADGTGTDTSPEPPNKRLKRASSIDLITGQETSKPIMTLRSPLTRALTPSQLPAPSALPQPVAETPAPPEVATTASSRECRVCRASEELWVAPCGHAICKTCWDTILGQKLECPFCRSKVRPKKLIKLNV